MLQYFPNHPAKNSQKQNNRIIITDNKQQASTANIDAIFSSLKITSMMSIYVSSKSSTILFITTCLCGILSLLCRHLKRRKAKDLFANKILTVVLYLFCGRGGATFAKQSCGGAKRSVLAPPVKKEEIFAFGRTKALPYRRNGEFCRCFSLPKRIFLDSLGALCLLKIRNII